MSQLSVLMKAFKNPTGAIQRVKNELNDGIDLGAEIVKTFLPPPPPSQIINQKEIRVIGLRRTGNHAIINWICKQQDGIVQHVNNVPINKNPYLHFYEGHARSNQYLKVKWKLKRESLGKFDKKDCLVYSYEDYGLQQITDPILEEKHDIYFGKSAERYDVLILRDPFNLFASRLKSGYIDIKDPEKTATDLWISYAKEYLGETEFLGGRKKVCINYNRWTVDPAYRHQIASELSLKFSDAGINHIPRNGGGSSFEGLSFEGKAAKMDVQNRWKHFANDPLYRELLNNQQLMAYSRRIFGEIPGTEALISDGV